jgi:calcium-dependent protein kinase
LADFGFAKCVDNFKKDMLASLVGTPLYMSPQILDNKKYTSKTDIWSIAFIFYESLFGKSINLNNLSTLDCKISTRIVEKY